MLERKGQKYYAFPENPHPLMIDKVRETGKLFDILLHEQKSFAVRCNVR